MATNIMVGLDDAWLSRALRFVSPSDVEQWVTQLVADRLSELERGEWKLSRAKATLHERMKAKTFI